MTMTDSSKDAKGVRDTSQQNRIPGAALSSFGDLTKILETFSCHTGINEDRIRRLESTMEQMMARVSNLGQEGKPTSTVKDSAFGKACTSCIQVYHSLTNNCSNRWVIPLDQIGKCGNDAPTQDIQLAPFVSAGHLKTEPEQERRTPTPNEISRGSRRITSSINLPVSVSDILFPSCANGEKNRYVKYSHNRSKNTQKSNASSQGNTSESSGTGQGSWKPVESETSSLFMQDESPNPSGTKPTFVAMIKTAIRDLRRYKRTSVEAISKYILLRYQVQNDILLQYLLDWMTDMNILERKEHNYVFSCKRLVKKTTVAVVNNNKRSRSSKRRKRSSKHRSRSRGRRAGRSKERYTHKKRRSHQRKRRTCAYEPVEYYEPARRKRRQRKSKRQGSKKKKVAIRKPCTCKHELRAAKNRVKVKSRYVRRGGRIYKEEEYI